MPRLRRWGLDGVRRAGAVRWTPLFRSWGLDRVVFTRGHAGSARAAAFASRCGELCPWTMGVGVVLTNVARWSREEGLTENQIGKQYLIRAWPCGLTRCRTNVGWRGDGGWWQRPPDDVAPDGARGRGGHDATKMSLLRSLKSLRGVFSTKMPRLRRWGLDGVRRGRRGPVDAAPPELGIGSRGFHKGACRRRTGGGFRQPRRGIMCSRGKVATGQQLNAVGVASL